MNVGIKINDSCILLRQNGVKEQTIIIMTLVYCNECILYLILITANFTSGLPYRRVTTRL